MSSKVIPIQMELPITPNETIRKENEECLKKYLRSVFDGHYRALFAREKKQEDAIEDVFKQINNLKSSMEGINESIFRLSIRLNNLLEVEEFEAVDRIG